MTTKTKGAILVALVLLISSCSIEKRHYTSGYNIEWKNRKHKANPSDNNNAAQELNAQQDEGAAENVAKNENEQNESTITAGIDNTILLPQTNTVENAPEWCDSIFLKNGEVISGKIAEISSAEVKYRKCENLSGPVYSIKRPDVLFVKYVNGFKEIISQDNSSSTDSTKSGSSTKSKPAVSDTDKKIEGFGLAGFICALLGVFVASIPLGILAVTFGIISMARISKHPRELKGNGFAFIAILLGVAEIFLAILFLSTAA